MTEENVVKTKDKWSILTLCARGHVPTDISVDMDSCGSSILVYCFQEDAQTDFDDYNRGVAMEVDVQQLKAAEHNFKANLHRLIGYRR